jgi:hypothetical protein
MATAPESPKHAQYILSSSAITITQVEPESVTSMLDYSRFFSTEQNMLINFAVDKFYLPFC